MKIIPIPIPSPKTKVIKCRHCGSTEVRPSHKSSGTGSRITYRCLACKRHFRVGSQLPNIKIVVAGGAILAVLLIASAAIFFSAESDDPLNQPDADVHNRAAMTQAQRKARQGDSQAQYQLGWFHWQNAEYQQAYKWLKAAADQGHTEAEYLLGMAYLNGRGTVQNYRDAMAMFSKSALRGHMEAQYHLGIIYRDGLSTPPDKESAYLWLNIAAADGHEEALQYRDKLALAMTTEEITRAQEASARTISQIAGAKAGKP
ncbi:MAG: hypothetical protein B7Y41_08210 [Hydrogenophilales bacterium 28-61-23]|nr:MAG: hypothetical protein B7Y41_08210 [Hydrogenophilales bacterium 28-61-23]